MDPSTPGPGAYSYLINNLNQTYTLPNFVYSSATCANPYSIAVVRTDTNTTVPFTWYSDSVSMWFKSPDSSQTGVTNYRIDAMQTLFCPSVTPRTSSYNFTFK